MAGCRNVMDVLNLWNDDPEELLLEMGFGCDEPDLSGRIPARFINYPSHARGINLQVFLDAQKTRLDLENPDVSNRFREVEVLQHVTTRLCSLVVSSSSTSFRPPLEKHRSPEARERRRRIGSLYRRASKKSLIQTQRSQDLTTPMSTCCQNTASESLPPSPAVGDKKVILHSGCQEGLSPPAEEQGAGLEPEVQSHSVSSVVAEEQAALDSLSQSPSFVDQEGVQERLQPGPQENVSPLTEERGAGRDPQLQSQVVSSTVAEELRNTSQEEVSDATKVLPDLSGGHFDSSSKQGLVPPCSYSQELQNLLTSQRLTRTSTASSTALVPSASSMQAASLCGESLGMTQDDPCTRLSTLHQYSEDIAWTTFTSIPPPPSPSSVQFDSSIQSPGDAQPQWTEVALHENSSMMSSPNYTHLTPSIPLDFAFQFLLSTSPPTKDSQGPQHRTTDSEGTCVFGNEQDETPTSGSFQLDYPLTPPPPPSDSNLEDGCPILSQISHKMSNPGCTSAKSSGSNPDQIDSATGRIADLREQTRSPQAESFPHHENKDMTSPPSVRDVSHTEVDQLPWDMECSLRENKPGGDEIHSDTEQTQHSVDTERSVDLTLGYSSVCHGDPTEPDPSSCSPQEEWSKVCRMESSGGRERHLVLHEPLDLQITYTNNRSEAEIKRSTEYEDSDLEFGTSVDGFEGDRADVDAFFQQLDDEGRVYWAEPVQVLTATLELKESGSFEVSGGSRENYHTPDPSEDNAPDLFSTVDTEQKSSDPAASSDASSSEALVVSPPATPDLKLSGHWVSVQMSSSPSSHIVHRKDVPYVDDSKRSSPPPSVFPLDTSDPLRAVQAWTDAQIQRNVQKLSHRAPLVAPNEPSKPSDLTHSSTLTFSPSPSFPRMCYDTPSHTRSPRMATNDRAVSASVDTGLWSDKEEEADGGGFKEPRNLWEGEESLSMRCCCSCDHRCCSVQRGRTSLHTQGDTPLSLGDLEEMMLCLQHFGSVHRNMEEQLCEDQASVYTALCDYDREMIQDLEVLRRAVKQEIEELEAHLNELAHHYDDSLKMKMHRLLDEQSLLYSHLSLPGAEGGSSGHAHSRTVGTQCRLPSPDTQRGHAPSRSRWNTDTPRRSPSGSESGSQGLGRSTESA